MSYHRKRTTTLTIRLNPRDALKWKQTAKLQGMNRNGWIVQNLNAASNIDQYNYLVKENQKLKLKMKGRL